VSETFGESRQTIYIYHEDVKTERLPAFTGRRGNCTVPHYLSVDEASTASAEFVQY
jgi:hypothetical protein